MLSCFYEYYLSRKESYLGRIEYWNILVCPLYNPTDEGSCCDFIPHSYFETPDEKISIEDRWFKVGPITQNGDSSDLILYCKQKNLIVQKRDLLDSDFH